ncbi:Pfs, NB-ARC and ankyrin domain protein [Aspergillus neoniger CBS 115656]|uniref:Pfs, NB-ARC and ankyrin domain protein n=1 Tax=Aspergillus neoniger (strain CBS 115656) TaxID=1448310 RepID=A0A318YTB8_ASPNB|nr:Pfs, NB-ARC and ankyrin domain protein [Aspergillus neoniger CBS 115656]PYH37666.1 Pfs, NB-ARC and ankyrin domain protein [Aspergillus neoniger CBS 115656]
MAMLDQIHPALPTHARDSNSYTLGSIGRHNIVIACLPAGIYGTTSAATVASNMFISFGSIRHLVMVGIGGGVPSASVDIRLGDVVVSIPTPCCEGVVQYNYGKAIRQGHFERTSTLNKPSTALLTAVSNLRAADLRNGSQIPVLISEMLARNPRMGYAAATAAAYAKQLLATIGVCGPGPISDPAVPEAITAAQHRASMMDALRPDQHESRQATIKPAHAKTCKWLLEEQEYVNWMDSNRFPEHRGFLWIKGKAGSGKSTMMKFAFLQADATVDADTKVLSFFFNARGEDLEKSTLGMYRSLLAQMLEKVPELQVLLDELNFERWDEKYPWCHELLQCTLRRSISQLGGRRVICFIDALDECEEEQVRAMVGFIQSLGEHAISSKVHLHVCFSSRHYPHIAIEKGLEMILEDQEGHADDITRYLQSELKIGRSKQAEDIRREIQAKASGIFLWMVLVVRILNREFQRGRLHALRKRLYEIPAKLSDLFKDILTRDTANMEDLLLGIQWILFARRPLKREELYFAILSADPDNLTEAWDPEDVTEQDIDRFVLSASKGLAETTRSKAKTVQIIHESVRDFLLKENGLRELWPEHQGNFEASSHDQLKQCCNNILLSETSNRIAEEQYIASASRDELKALRGSVSRKVPFLQYAVHNVLQNSEAAEKGGIRQGCFLGNFNFSRWKRCSNFFERYKARRHTESACLPYILAQYDLSNLILAIFKDKPRGSIPSRRELDFLVSYAVRNDHREFLDSIIRSQLQDASASSTACIEMALRYTIQFDREAMFASLMTRTNVNLNLQDKDGKQYLHYVIQYGRDSMFDRMLAMREIDLNAPDVHGDTPLHYAIRFEQQYIFTKLITMDRINLSVQNMANQTLLHCAMQYGREKMFDLLIMRDNADITAHLCSAIERNDELVFNRLLATQPVDPMILAIERSNPAMIKSLLEMSCTEVPLSEQGWNRMLQCAALNRWGEIVELLITMDDLFSHLNSPCAEAVLLYAAWSGHKTLVDKILATGKPDPNAKALDGKTALAYAAYGGYTDIAIQLLSKENVEPDVKDWYGMTPLAYAASRGHEDIVMQLLSTEGINVDAADSLGITPLIHAATSGHTAVVHILLSTGNANPDLKDRIGFSPLSEAALNGYEDVVRRLLAVRRADVLPEDVGGRKALLAAKAYQHDRIVKILEDWLSPSPHFEQRSTA